MPPKRNKPGRSSMRDKVRQRAEGRESSGGGGWLVGDGLNFFKPKAGTSNFRVLPYEVTADDHPEVPAGELWYQRTVWIHYNVGAENKSVICPLKTFKQRCPICEHRAKLSKDPDIDEDTIKEMAPRERELFNILPDGEDEPQLLTMSYHCFGKKLEEEVREGEDEYGGFADLEGGYLLKVRFKEKKLGKNTFLETTRIDFTQDDDLDEGILSEVYNLDDLLNVLSYDQISAMFHEDEAGEEPPPRRGSSRKPQKEEDPTSRCSSRRGKPEPEEPEDPEEEPEEPTSRCSSRRGGSSKQEEPPARGSRRASRGRQEEPEPEEPEDDCPFGYVFGTDCNSKEECDECDLWDDCQKAKDAAGKKGGRSRR